MNKRKEADVKRAIMDYLKAKNCLVIPYRNVGIYKKDTGRYIPATSLGISDILGLDYQGRFFAIEVKLKKPAPSAHTDRQEAFLAKVRAYGCRAFMAYSVQDCIDNGL